MNKKFFKATIVTLVLAAGIFFFQQNNKTDNNNLGLSNIEALAAGEITIERLCCNDLDGVCSWGSGDDYYECDGSWAN